MFTNNTTPTDAQASLPPTGHTLVLHGAGPQQPPRSNLAAVEDAPSVPLTWARQAAGYLGAARTASQALQGLLGRGGRSPDANEKALAVVGGASAMLEQ